MPPRKKGIANEIQLVPLAEFENAVKKVLSNSKTDSDRQLVEFHASNKVRRQAKRPK